MMQGYWARPDLNKQAFFRRPVCTDYEDIFYRTGDLVQQSPDGNYVFQGRKDRQIKTRGFRVELDEVEAALVAHDQVEEAAVFSIPDENGNNRIEAAVILHVASAITPDALIYYLKGRLTWYAVPVHITVLEAFPHTSSGKIDRRKLQQQALNNI